MKTRWPDFPRQSDWIPVGESRALPLVGNTNIVQSVARLIDESNGSICIHVYALRHEGIIARIECLARRGTIVRVILSDPRGRWRSKVATLRDLQTIERLRSNGVGVTVLPRVVANRSSSYICCEDHVKLVIVDGTTAYVGSANLDLREDNLDFGVLVTGPVVRTLSSCFEQNFRDRAGDRVIRYSHAPHAEDSGRTGIRVLDSRDVFSGAKAAFLSALGEARESVVLSYWELNDVDVLRALEERKLRTPRFQICVLLGPPKKVASALGISYPLPMNIEAYDRLAALRCQMSWFSDPHGRSILHGKCAIFDRRRVLLGSADLTARSLEGNYELCVQVESHALAGVLSDVIKAQIECGHKGRHHVGFAKLRSAFHLRLEIALMTLKWRWNRTKRLALVGRSRNYRSILLRQLGANIRWLLGAKVESSPEESRSRAAEAIDALANRARNAGLIKTFASPAATGTETSDLVYLFGGYSHGHAATIVSGRVAHASHGWYGWGAYLTNSPDTALDFGFARAVERRDPIERSCVVIFRIRGMRPFDYRNQYSEYRSWIGRRGNIGRRGGSLLVHFCRANGFNAVFMAGQEGRRRDYFMLLDLRCAEPYQLVEYRRATCGEGREVGK